MNGTSIPMTFWEKYDPACHHWSTQQAAETTKCCLNLFQADKVQRGYWLWPTQIRKINRGSEEVFITVIIDSWTMTKCSWLTATIQSFVFISCFLPYHSHSVACKESVGRILDYKHIEFNESKCKCSFSYNLKYVKCKGQNVRQLHTLINLILVPGKR